MPSRWEVTLPGVDAAEVRLEHLHAVVSAWFDADEHAHAAGVKAYSVGLSCTGGDGAVLEIGLVDDALTDRLLSRAAQGVRLRLGSRWIRLAHAPRQMAAAPWAHLAASGTTDAWCLRFVSPTTFRRRNAFTPSPSLRAILGSLRTRWRSFAPADVAAVTLDLSTEPVWLTDIDVASHVLRVDGRIVSGFTGRLRFTCDAGPQVAAAVDQLVRLAPFAGVGAHTTRGFGMVRLERGRTHPPMLPASMREPSAPVAAQ